MERPPSSILSLGCGTCTHEITLAQQGMEVVAVDLSEPMLKIAHGKIHRAGVAIDLRHGDVRTVDVGRTFPVVISLFNIAGYQRSDADFRSYIRTAARHLYPGGLFIFDAWQTSGVMQDPPTNRSREINLKNGHTLVRDTQQTIDIERSILDISFRLKEMNGAEVVKTFSENHPMRFFSLDEIDTQLAAHQLKRIHTCRDMQFDAPLTASDWNMTIVATRV